MFSFFFFKQKTAYEIKECDWSSDVCSSDLVPEKDLRHQAAEIAVVPAESFCGDAAFPPSAPLPPPPADILPPRDPLAALKKHRADSKNQTPKKHHEEVDEPDLIEELKRAMDKRRYAIAATKEPVSQGNNSDDKDGKDAADGVERHAFNH